MHSASFDGAGDVVVVRAKRSGEVAGRLTPAVRLVSGFWACSRGFGQEAMAVHHGIGEVDQFAIAGAGLFAQQLEGLFLINRVPFHQDPFRTLDGGAASERSPKVVVLREAAKHNVHRTLPIINVVVRDVSKNATF